MLGVALYLHGRSEATETLKLQTEQQSKLIANIISKTLSQKQQELVRESQSQELREFVSQYQNDTDRIVNISSDKLLNERRSKVQQALDDFVDNNSTVLAVIRIVNQSGATILEAKNKAAKNSLTPISSEDTLADKNVWSSVEGVYLPPRIVKDNLDANVRYTIPIYIEAGGKKNVRGALVADLLAENLWNNFIAPQSGKNFTLVSDKTGYVLFHTNSALRYQNVNTMLQGSFVSIGETMRRGENGAQFYDSNKERWLVAYNTVEGSDLSIAVGGYQITSRSWQLIMLLGVVLYLLSCAIAAWLLWRIVGRLKRNLERVSKDTAAIAEGNLDKTIGALSSDDLRPLGISVNIIKERLREQFKREAEMQQFQTFTRLTAMLTHDLKNSTAVLSLLVKNMELRYDNRDFREDAMKSLRATTDKLQMMLGKLNQPVTTLSSEYRKLVPNDIVPIIKRVVSSTAEQNSQHEIELKLPETLMVKIDTDKIERVIENLIINALEAMKEKKGKITIEAEKLGDNESFFSIADTGVGMSEKFQKEKMFRPFATTKEKGFGLGLYSCHEVVKAHEGRIEVESKLNFGTTFKVVLPSA